MPPAEEEFKLYRKRWVMLALFSVCCLMESFQWFQYSVISNLIVKYYGVTYLAVDWLYMLFTVMYLVIIIPAMFTIDKKNLKLNITLGILAVTIGSWIKVISVSRDRFYVTFIGQAVGATAEVFTFRNTLRLVALWFGAGEVSTACSISVFSVQLGSAVGFLLPSLIVHDHKNIEDIGHDLKVLFYAFSITATVLLILVVVFFQSEPPTPPSAARDIVISKEYMKNYKKSIKKMLTNRNFMFLLLSYSLINATSDSGYVFLNEIILRKFPGYDATPGKLGIINLCFGMISILLTGTWLDRTHKFKASAIAASCLLCISQLGYTYSVYYALLPLVYVTYALNGMFYGFYQTIAFEFGAELMFPEPEAMVGGLFNIGLLIIELLFINLGNWILSTFGDYWINIFLFGLPFTAFVLVLLVEENLKRLEAQNMTNVDRDNCKFERQEQASVETISSEVHNKNNILYGTL